LRLRTQDKDTFNTTLFANLQKIWSTDVSQEWYNFKSHRLGSTDILKFG